MLALALAVLRQRNSYDWCERDLAAGSCTDGHQSLAPAVAIASAGETGTAGARSAKGVGGCDPPGGAKMAVYDLTDL